MSARPRGGSTCCARRSTDAGMGTVATRFAPGVAVAVALGALTTAQEPRLNVLPVQGSVSMLVGAGANVTLQTGPDGVLLVDSPAAALVPQALAEIRKL